MRIVELDLRDFKGVDAHLDWSQINVLFGPNDAGKTNILEAVGMAFGEIDPVRDREVIRPPRFSAVLEFRDKGDDELLAALLQRDHVPPIFPTAAQKDEDDPAAVRVAPARLRWETRGGRAFSLETSASPGGESSFGGDLLPLHQALARLQERAFKAAKRRLEDSQEAWVDVDLVLSGALSTRRARFDRGVLGLLCPSAEDVGEDVAEAAARLAATRWREDPALGDLVAHLAEPSAEGLVFLRLIDVRALRPFDIVWSSSADRDSDVEEALRRDFDAWYVGAQVVLSLMRHVSELAGLMKLPEVVNEVKPHVQAWGKIVESTSPTDRWLRHFPLDAMRPALWVEHLAKEVAYSANERAAPIVRDAGELSVSVLPPAYWLRQNRRLEPQLAQSHREKPAPLRSLGLGLRAWSAVAVLEAAAATRVEIAPYLQQLRKQWAVSTARLKDQTPPNMDTFGERRPLLIVDEPERHLHPRAQVEIAGWLARGARERDTLLATHAVPFLNLPEEGASYSLVTRGGDGITSTTNVSADTFGFLESTATEAGLSGPAEALQTVRLVLLVEGSHDELVLRHFYRADLARGRILVVPIRGALNVNAIFDAPWLSRLGLPIVILFDDIDERVVMSSTKPPASNVAARSVWELLRHWDMPSPKPRVASFSLPDIFRAIPEKCIAKAVEAEGGRFPGWDVVDRAFAGSNGVGFKPFLMKRSGLPPDTDSTRLLARALEICRSRPEEELERAMTTVLDLARMAAGTTHSR